MKKEKFLKLTETLFILSQFLSEENLSNKLREKALEIYSHLSLIVKNPEISSFQRFKIAKILKRDLDLIEDFLDLARGENIYQSLNFLILKNEYGKIKNWLKETHFQKKKEEEKQKREKKEKRERKNKELISRKKKILQILEERGALPLKEIKKFFPKLSERTLRRDLNTLIEKKLVEKRGEKRATSYRFIRHF